MLESQKGLMSLPNSVHIKRLSKSSPSNPAKSQCKIPKAKCFVPAGAMCDFTDLSAARGLVCTGAATGYFYVTLHTYMCDGCIWCPVFHCLNTSQLPPLAPTHSQLVQKQKHYK